MGTRHSKFGWMKDQQAKVINAETITVYLSGTTTVATIYAASAGGSAITGGAITVSSVGFFQYWVDEDDYGTTQAFKHVFTGAKFQTTTLDPIVIFPGITTSSSDTLTNKTIDADNNTISNLEIGAEVEAKVVADIDLDGFNIDNGGVVFLKEQAEADAIVAASGQIWVDTATPNVLYFTDDDDTDFRLSYTPTGTGNLVLATSPTITSAVLNTAISGTAFLDQDDMSDDSATKVSSQQAIKKYVDDNTITLGTEQPSTSGTAITFTGIPAGVQKITIMLVGVSTDGTEKLLIQIGDTDGIEATGYLGCSFSSASNVNSTVGFLMDTGSAASDVIHGSVVLTLEDSAAFTWTCFGVVGRATADGSAGAGSKSLSKELDRVRITTTGTPDDFDLGAINIQYE